MNDLSITKFFRILPLLLLSAGLAASCVGSDHEVIPEDPGKKQVNFDITVTRDGEPVPTERITTRGGIVDAEDFLATMDVHRPFGLVAIEKDTRSILLDNTAVHHDGRTYSMPFLNGLASIPSPVVFSAYYPHVQEVEYNEDNSAYSMSFSVSETNAGPLVSKTVERYISQINSLPLEFRHITNDIGYKICDVTPVKELQGLIHLRTLRAVNVPSAGVYVNDLTSGRGDWTFRGYYRSIYVFTGDALLGVGSANEKFVGSETLVDRMVDSRRYYAIPDELEPGKQYVEVVFDVDPFTYHGEPYSGLQNQVRRYMLYGLIPDNVCTPGKQYTFHIGVDLTSVFRDIKFSASINDWETKIYENNDDF